MMTTAQQGLITLLKSSILGKPLPLPEDFELGAAMERIRRHHIVPLAWDGAVQCGIPPQSGCMGELFRGYCKALQISERQGQALRALYRAFEEAGIDHLPLKGSTMRYLYPRPELRTMGDADILIRQEQYDRIIPVMESLGYTAGEETDHELVWQSDSLYLELHKHLIPTYNRDLYPYFADVWKKAEKTEGTRYAMRPEDEFIFLFVHYAKHYRDGGIGCRHVLDLWVFLRANPQMDEGYILKDLRKLHLEEFYQNTRQLIRVWFEEGTSDEKTAFMTDFIFSSGSFGQMESRVQSRTVRDVTYSRLGGCGRLVYLWKTAFPGVDVLRGKYTILKTCPWLLPVVWLIRPCYKVFFEFSQLRRKKQELDAITDERLKAKAEMLRYVGLEYRA